MKEGAREKERDSEEENVCKRDETRERERGCVREREGVGNSARASARATDLRLNKWDR